jgi:hypothetical protein
MGHREHQNQMRGTWCRAECVIAALLAAAACAQSPYIREDSIGTTPNSQVSSDPFSPLSVEAWTGEKFILMPRNRYDAKRGYIIKKTPTSDISYVPYLRYKGKVITVRQVLKDPRFPDTHNIFFEVDGTREHFITTDFFGFVYGWALKRDIDYARDHYVGKTLWLRNPEADTYDAATQKTEYFKVKNLQPVKVIDIVLSDTEGWPLRFILEDKQKRQFFKVAKLSGANSDPILKSAYRFNDVFFTEDPRKKYTWDESIFAALENGKLFVGMSQEQARISWGNPIEINRTISGNRAVEQWVYGGKRYVYFDDDKLTSIQD